MKIEKPGEYKTRMGLKAVVLCLDAPGKRPVKGYIVLSNGDTAARDWDSYGFRDMRTAKSQFDIVSEWKEPVKVSGWVNMYDTYLSCIYSTKRDADDGAGFYRTACVYISGVEGKGPKDSQE